MPNTSPDGPGSNFVDDPSLVPVFGPLPTRTYRGEWAPVGARKAQYRQLTRDYAPVEKLELSEDEISAFSKHGLPDVVKFRSGNKTASGTQVEPGFSPFGVYYWFPREPNYTIHRADNALGIYNIIVKVQEHMMGAWNIFFPFSAVYPHPALISMWFEKFGDTHEV